MAKNALPDSGLILNGEVIGRKRRQIDLAGGKIRYVITLRIMAGDNVFSVDRWCDVKLPSDCPVTGSPVSMPVRIRTFTTKSGVSRTGLEWGPQSSEEEF